ncbi:chaplin family protein [Actinomadura sp. 6K520]|uniref:chaplin family protein n=1 Tax=Actinomadura sp. 6K520 TaxID=2530364 RepID=UPI00104A9CEF|nr:chaplin family protein [Actinomadura sp. 6K520]TDE27137.1 chaplin [Actinomadura sp. 6K520]
MRKWARNTGRAALVAAGAVVVGAAFGSAGTAGAATLPGDFGGMYDGARHGAGKGGGGDVNMASAGNVGLGNGNQVYAPIDMPISVCGNAIAIAGLAQAECEGGAHVGSGGSDDGYQGADRRDHRHGRGGDEVNQLSYGNVGLGNGNQVYAPIDAPISVCGNAVAVLFAQAQAQCEGGATVERGNEPEVNQLSAGNVGALNGNQFYAPIDAPISVCGNSIAAVLAAAQAQCEGGASVERGDKHLPPTLRTPPKKHKVYKPAKNRPAAGKKPLPSTQRGSASRMATAAPDYRRADGLPAVQQFMGTLKRTGAPVPGLDVQPGEIGPKLSPDDGQPVNLGTPVLR